MNIVLAHDYLIQMGGAERVVATMHGEFPAAPIYTSAVDNKALWKEFREADVRRTWMQHFPAIQHHTHFKKYALLYPLAFRSFGEIDADVAWISCSTFAKFLRFSPSTRTVCYLHNTTRFLWQTDNYLDYEIGSRPLNRAVRAILPKFREWDRDAAASMKVLVANSKNVQDRIKRFYGLDSIVVHPPVETSRFEVSDRDDGYYLVVARLLGYKNIELPVRAFSRTGRRLVVLGEGPYQEALQALAGTTVEFRGRASDADIHTYFSNCRGLIIPGEEDFGITPVEAMAAGKPVVALAKGGVLETVVEGKTGVLYSESSEEALLDAVERCEATTWDREAIRAHALRFSRETFLEKMKAILFGG